jgi:hypothetical protein
MRRVTSEVSPFKTSSQIERLAYRAHQDVKACEGEIALPKLCFMGVACFGLEEQAFRFNA